MFNLDEAIAEWRRQMLAAGIKTPTPLDELESHLREDVQRQLCSGPGAERAFEVAVERLGKAGALKDEFKKIGTTRPLRSRLMVSVAAVFVGFIILLSSFAIVVCFKGWGERATASAAVVFTLLVAFGWKYAVPFLPVIASAGKRWAIGLTSIACGIGASSFFCNFILPHFEVSADHQLPAIGLWAVFLIAVFSCAGVGLLMGAHEREIRGMTKSPFRTRPFDHSLTWRRHV